MRRDIFTDSAGWEGLEKEFDLLKFATMLKDSETIGAGTVTLQNDFFFVFCRSVKVLRKNKNK